MVDNTAQERTHGRSLGASLLAFLQSERAAVSHAVCGPAPIQTHLQLVKHVAPVHQHCLNPCERTPALLTMQWAAQNAVGMLFAALFAVILRLQFTLACLCGVLYRQVWAGNARTNSFDTTVLSTAHVSYQLPPCPISLTRPHACLHTHAVPPPSSSP
jgi:hypothetical protein